MEAKIIRTERDFIPLISTRLSEEELLAKVKDISALTKMQINAAAIKEVVYHILMNNTRGEFTHLEIIDSSLLFRATILDMIILCFANKEIAKDQLPDTIYLGLYLVVETFFKEFFSKQYAKKINLKSFDVYLTSPLHTDLFLTMLLYRRTIINLEGNDETLNLSRAKLYLDRRIKMVEWFLKDLKIPILLAHPTDSKIGMRHIQTQIFDAKTKEIILNSNFIYRIEEPINSTDNPYKTRITEFDESFGLNSLIIDSVAEAQKIISEINKPFEP